MNAMMKESPSSGRRGTDERRKRVKTRSVWSSLPTKHDADVRLTDIVLGDSDDKREGAHRGEYLLQD